MGNRAADPSRAPDAPTARRAYGVGQRAPRSRLRSWEGRFSIIIGRSEHQIEFKNRFLDCVFLDGAHDYLSVSRDICHWLPKVRPGGLICGHDYERRSEDCDPERLVTMSDKDYCAEDGLHYGVIQAVDELFGGRVGYGGRCWWVSC